MVTGATSSPTHTGGTAGPRRRFFRTTRMWKQELKHQQLHVSMTSPVLVAPSAVVLS